MACDVLLVALGATAGLRAAEDELAGALRRAGARVAVVRATPQGDVRTLAYTDWRWARAARAAARVGLAEHAPRAVVYSTTTAALLWPRPGAIRFDALAADTRPGRHGIWQRPVEARRLAQSTLLVPQDAAALGGHPTRRAPVVVPVPVEPSGRPDDADPRDIAVLTYAANPAKKGLDRLLAAWALARRDGEELVVCGTRDVPPAGGVRDAGMLEPEAFRALLRRARVFAVAPRREDHGIVQLEALADGCRLVTTTAPGPYVALPIARSLDARLVVEPDDPAALAAALRTALDAEDPGYGQRALAALAPHRRAAVDATVARELLPALLARCKT